MDNLNCKPNNPSDCCQKFLASDMEGAEFMYSYLYTCALNGNPYLSFPILVLLNLNLVYSFSYSHNLYEFNSISS
jgi:hypothetical protein